MVPSWGLHMIAVRCLPGLLKALLGWELLFTWLETDSGSGRA